MANQLAERVASPVIDSRRCMLAASVDTASSEIAPAPTACRHCLDACPRKALNLEGRNLYVDLCRCDGCGVCAAACSEGAITVPVESALDGSGAGLRSFAACAEAIGSPEAALIPCLHAMGLESLAELYRHRVRELVLALAPCAGCRSGSTPRLAARVDSFNSLLSPQSMDQVRVVELPPVEWRRRRDAAVRAAKNALRSAIERGTGSARRALFPSAASASREAGGDAPGDADGSRLTLMSACAPASRLASTSASPRIDAQLCTACLACVKVCPEGVFAVTCRQEGRRELLVADGLRCTGCNLCADICPANSITISRGKGRSLVSVVLEYAGCKVCGARFRVPAARADGRALCPVCASANQGSKVAQAAR